MLQTLSHVELEDLIQRRAFTTLRDRLVGETAQDIADALATLEIEGEVIAA